MPATTPNGYPYAEPTDPLVQWPATSQQLAEKIDSVPVVVGVTPGMKIARGVVSYSDAQPTVTVDLSPYGFTSPPVVSLTPYMQAAAGFAYIRSSAAASFSFSVETPAGDYQPACDVHWIAIGT
jgi:hypothetical protein